MRVNRAILALLALTAGCAGVPSATNGAGNGQPAASAGGHDKSVSFSVRWRRNIGIEGFSVDYSGSPIVHPGRVRWRTPPDFGDMGNSVLLPALMNGSLYVANSYGGLVRIEPSSGKQIWRVKTGITITGGVGAGGGLIVVGGEKGDVMAYGDDGKLRWQTKASSEVLGPPLVAGGVVVVRSGDGRIAGLDPADGKRKWLYEHVMPSLVVRNTSGVTLHGDTLFVGLPAGKLVAIELATGNVKWETTLSEARGATELERISDITSPPLADDETVCAVSFQGRVGCFNSSQGGQMWSKPLSSDKGLAMSSTAIYVSDTDGALYAMERSSGSSEWKNSQLAGQHTAAPLLYGNYLIAGDKKGFVYAFRIEDGKLAARLRTDGSPILQPPIVMDGGLLVQTYRGGLYSIVLR